MKANYKRLVSIQAINKFKKNDNVTVEVLGKICKALECTLDGSMKFKEDGK